MNKESWVRSQISEKVGKREVWVRPKAGKETRTNGERKRGAEK